MENTQSLINFNKEGRYVMRNKNSCMQLIYYPKWFIEFICSFLSHSTLDQVLLDYKKTFNIAVIKNTKINLDCFSFNYKLHC